MVMLRLFYFVKKACFPTTCRAVFPYLQHSGDVGPESTPWAKEANPSFSQRHYKARYGESFTRQTGCVQAGVRGEPAGLRQLGHHTRPTDAMLCKGHDL